LLDVKRVIRALSMSEARQIAEEALAQPDAASVSALLDTWMRGHTEELAAVLGLNGDA
jgi:phosphoenolpyruvate-protein kinase (PTS system EI component)